MGGGGGGAGGGGGSQTNPPPPQPSGPPQPAPLCSMSVDPSATTPFISPDNQAKWAMLWPKGFSPVGLATARGIPCPGSGPAQPLMQSDINFFQQYLGNPPINTPDGGAFSSQEEAQFQYDLAYIWTIEACESLIGQLPGISGITQREISLMTTACNQQTPTLEPPNTNVCVVIVTNGVASCQPYSLGLVTWEEPTSTTSPAPSNPPPPATSYAGGLSTYIGGGGVSQNSGSGQQNYQGNQNDNSVQQNNQGNQNDNSVQQNNQVYASSYSSGSQNYQGSSNDGTAESTHKSKSKKKSKSTKAKPKKSKSPDTSSTTPSASSATDFCTVKGTGPGAFSSAQLLSVEAMFNQTHSPMYLSIVLGGWCSDSQVSPQEAAAINSAAKMAKRDHHVKTPSTGALFASELTLLQKSFPGFSASTKESLLQALKANGATSAELDALKDAGKKSGA